MQRFKQILVIVTEDANGSRPSALGWAADLAQRNDATLTLIDVIDPMPWYARLALPATSELRAEHLIHQREQRLNDLAAAVRDQGVRVEARLIRGHPNLEAVREVLRGRHDLLIKDVASGEHGFFGSMDLHLLRSCPCPVWLIKPGQEARSLERILAAVDPSPVPDDADERQRHGILERNRLNVKILELAHSLAVLEGSVLHVVHAWNAPGEAQLRSDPDAPSEPIDAYVDAVQAVARRALDELVAPFATGPETASLQVHLLAGDPSHVIPEFARAEQIDLIVMGTVARTGIAGLLIGNTAETILRRVECSVLTVKPEGFVSPVTLEES